MNKTQKILISLIVTILALLSFSITSIASNKYNVGDTTRISLDRYEGDQNMYCLEHHQHLSNYDVKKYTVVRIVDIIGTVATDDTGKKVDNIHNARLAYIVGSKEEGYGKGSRKNAVWNFMGTWMHSVGKNFSRVKGLHNGVKGSSTHLDSAAAKYEKRFNKTKGDLKNIEDKSDSKKIKGKIDEKTNSMIVGPFKWDFEGDISSIIVKNKEGKKISDVKFAQYNGKSLKIINEKNIKSNKNCYIYVPSTEDVTKMTVTINAKVDVKSAKLYFLKCEAGSFQNMMIAEPDEKKQTITDTFDYKPQLYGTLDIIKVNQDNTEVKLPNVEFYLKDARGNFVNATQSGDKFTVQAYGDRANATKLKTDANGKLKIEKLLIGKYELLEVNNPNYGYEVVSEENPKAFVIQVNAGSANPITLGNKQTHVKISGYVWKDIASKVKGYEEKTFRDAIYSSENDQLLSGITVRLMDRKTGQAVMTTITDSNGAYLFDNAEIEKVVAGDYYIEFEYDGITYQNVKPLVDGNKKAQNTSKAAEGETVRDTFNNKFATIEGRGSSQADKGDAISTTGTKTELSYTRKTDNKTEDGASTYTTTTLNHEVNKENYKIIANTDNAGYNLKDVFTYGDTEIKYNNLGLYERSQPNIAVMKDLENVRVTINGYENTYKYATRYKNMGKPAEDGFNVGVKFGTKYGSRTYTRPIYKEDYQFISTDKSKELKVYATYRIVMKNNSISTDNIKAKVNSIADYFDKGYVLVGTGRELDAKGNISTQINHGEVQALGNYNKVIINTNELEAIEPGGTQSIYVQLQLTPEKLSKIMDVANNNTEVDREYINFAETNSYSILKDNKPYAGIDMYSNPGNVDPGNKETYEADTDKAPSLRLEVANSRKITGAVFEDSTGELKIRTGEVRQGDGKYGAGDTGIAGVKVTLTETSGTGRTYTVTTGENGNFVFGDNDTEQIIPGDYTLTYTWGDQTYTVQDYKSTIYSQETQERKNNIANWDKATDWYRKEADIRFSDAKDVWEQRKAIDEQTKIINNSLWKADLIKTIDATTPKIAIGVEMFDTTAIDGKDLHYQICTDSDGHKFVTTISNIDFGIVKRPMQQLAIEKRVSRVKATLANGQVIVDARVEIDKNGNAHLVGDYKYTTYMQPDANNKGFVKLELDNELIQGTKLEVEYTIKVVNQSELDYDSEEFYYYGEKKGNIVTLTPSKVVDYLDSGWAFEEARNTEGGWLTKQQNDIKDLVNNNVLNEETSKIGSRTILLTEKLKDIKLEPIEGKNTATLPLKVSKVLASSDEISLDNDTEILQIEKPFGSTTTSKPGNYIPGVGAETADGKTDSTEADDSQAEPVIVTPATGENRDYIMPIVVGTIALIILGAGVVIIKKKTLTKE